MTAQARDKVTLNDVARAAGVSRQTVSNVLNGTGRVGAAARARVLDMVAELGYQPHHGARSLRSRRTMQLGYLMPDIQLQPGNLIMTQFLQALAAAAAQHRYRVLGAHQAADPADGAIFDDPRFAEHVASSAGCVRPDTSLPPGR